jgi:hypothetical protein
MRFYTGWVKLRHRVMSARLPLYLKADMLAPLRLYRARTAAEFDSDLFDQRGIVDRRLRAVDLL